VQSACLINASGVDFLTLLLNWVVASTAHAFIIISNIIITVVMLVLVVIAISEPK
jgi:hypothetical protein